MPSVHRDPRSPHGVWYCRLTLADGRRVWRSTKSRNKRQAQLLCDGWQQAETEAARTELTKHRAQQIVNETLRRIGSGAIERVTTRKWLEDWLESKQRISPATRLGYKHAVSEFLVYLGPRGEHRPLEAITETDIRGFAALLRKEGLSPTTIHKLVRSYLSIPFEKARRQGKIQFNPVATTDFEQGQSAQRATFTPEQVSRLVAASADCDWAGAILLAYGCGGRLQDIANLKWSSLDLQYGILSFRDRKLSRPTIVALHPDFVDWIAKGSVPDDPDAYVFPTLANRSGGGHNGLSLAFQRIMERAGIKPRLIRERTGGRSRSLRGLSFHSFRHSAASAVFNQAALREITRRVTNHAAGGVVDRYIHQDLEALREAVKLVPRLPRGISEGGNG
jgi:integrase